MLIGSDWRKRCIVAPACDDPRQRRPDIALAKRVLDWEPRVDLDEGLARTIDYFRRTLADRKLPAAARTNARTASLGG